MADDFEIDIGVINITANPHPKGIYPKLLEKVANTHINFFDQDWAALSKPEKQEPGYYLGRIWVWTELDPDAPAVNKQKLEEVTLEEAHISLPPEFGINGKTFLYVLRENDHRIFFEWKNDQGSHFAPSRLAKVLDRLFFKTNTDGQIEVTISVQQDEDALDFILRLPVIKSLEIEVRPPNPDDNDDDAEKVLEELDRQNAKSKKTRYDKKAGRNSFKPSEETLREARVAASGNGSVTATGLNEKKKTVKLSTSDYPMKIRKKALDKYGVIGALVDAAKKATIGRRT